MIWSGSELFVSFSKILHNHHHKFHILNQKIGVLFCGFVMFVCFMTITHINLFFTLTDIGLIFAYVSTMIALLLQPAAWKSGQNIKTILGLITGIVIFGISIQNLISEITTVFS
jgi:hypothetical protein